MSFQTVITVLQAATTLVAMEGTVQKNLATKLAAQVANFATCV